MGLTVYPRRVALALTLVVLVLTLASLAGQLSLHVLGHGRLFGLDRLFDLDTEGNIPTWYASVSLLFCSVLLAIIGHYRKTGGDRYHLHWRLLSGVFLLFSIDEVAQIHESSNRRLRVALKASGLLHQPWVIPGAVLVLVIGMTYRRFIADLPAETRRGFLTAGTLFASGALGVEVVGNWYASLYGQQNMTYVLLATLEELLEMIGTVVFIHALLSYMGVHLKEIRVRVDGRPPPSRS
jgi:hypothetical protein